MFLNCGVGEDSWESLGLQGDPTIHSEGDQPWDFFGRNDAKAETPVLWPPDAESWLIWKDPDAGKNWGQEERGMMTEDEMVEWHHQLNGHEFGQTPGIGDGQGSWHAAVHGVTESWTRLSDWTALNCPWMRVQIFFLLHLTIFKSFSSFWLFLSAHLALSF